MKKKQNKTMRPRRKNKSNRKEKSKDYRTFDYFECLLP